MCEVNAYIKKNGHEVLVMEGVFVVRPEGDKVLLENIFGEQKLVDGRIRQVSLMEHKIIFQ
ncbi:MAG: CooT family nickel-binding protein [Deltaproteobacteria bacterium]|nr:CooT family nickel-binding protein [Deltaproteobacteria bacterium]